MAKKFIINEGCFVMTSSLEFHRDIVKDHSTTKGGGWWHMKDNNLYLYGNSDEFGQASIEDVKAAFEKYTTLRLSQFNIFYSTSQSISDAVENGVKIQEAKI